MFSGNAHKDNKIMPSKRQTDTYTETHKLMGIEFT
jgi:hypothetical protein